MHAKTMAVCATVLTCLSIPSRGFAEVTRFEVDLPKVVLTHVPIDQLTIRALTEHGEIDTDFSGSPTITGLVLKDRGETIEFPPFEKGVLELRSDPAKQEKLELTAPQIEISLGKVHNEFPVRQIWRWWAIMPPVLAVILAILMRNVLVALFLGILSGAAVLTGGNLWQAFLNTIQIHLMEQLVEQGMEGHSHMQVILFTLFLGAMIGVMSRGGGTSALVHSLARFCRRRNHGQMLTSGLGMVVFFDDYANTVLVGGTMRPVTDRLKISRAKLAFLVDSTAAPVAGLALISTWVGVEVGYIRDTYADLGMTSEVYGIFVATIPYRFYPVFLLFFVWMLAWMGRDFGTMLKVEQKALSEAETPAGGATAVGTDQPVAGMKVPRKEFLSTALVPLGVLLISIMIGLYWTGTSGLESANAELREAGKPELVASFWTLIAYADSYKVLLISSFLGSAAAILMVVITRSLTLQESTDAWLNGTKDMLMAVVILVMAWAISQLCNKENLHTAEFLVDLTAGLLPAEGMPTLAFLLSAGVAFATGSSWATMGLLMPLFISLTFYLLRGEFDPAAIESHSIMLGTIGGILAGSIFGDHCSPISDTTILSSAASGCDHLEHVVTQMPYAVTVAVVAVLFGYLPIGLGLGSAWIWIPLGIGVMYLILRFVGRRPEDSMQSI